MSKLKVTDEEVIAAIRASHGIRSRAARQLGVNVRTLIYRIDRLKGEGVHVPDSEYDPARMAREKRSVAVRELPSKSEQIEVPILPDGKIDVRELIERRKSAFARKDSAAQARKLIPVRVRGNEPIGITLLGDPHVDDDGTDLGSLERDIRVIQRTDGLYAACVGDVQNNWVGRLAKLYGEQETTTSQAWQLVEWFVEELRGHWLFMVHGNHDCHDMETEALTRRGWLRYDEIALTDEVLSLDPDTGECDWYSILGRVDRENTEGMVSIESQTVSACVTANHRILHRKRDWKKQWSALRYTSADKLPPRFRVPVSGITTRDDAPISDDWLSLTGWLLTDGSIFLAKKGAPRVTFYQSKPDTGLEGILSRLGLEHSMVVRYRDVEEVCGRALVKKARPSREYRLTAESARRVLAVIPERKKLPAWAAELSNRQFQILLEAIIAGDGSYPSNGGRTSCVVHGEKQFLDSLQSVAVCHGWSAFLSIAREKDYRLNLCQRDEWEAERGRVVSRVEASPRVWCLTVPLGNFMVRRNGKAHFSGNCWAGSSDPLRWIQRQVGVSLTGDHTVRVALKFTNGVEVRVAARHDWPGNSMWNPSHGQLRAASLTHHDHIIVSGHKHTGGYQMLRIPSTGMLAHLLQLGSYKIHDSYADALGLPSRLIAPSATAIIDPTAGELGLVRVEHDIEAAADYLTWLRARRAA